MASILTAASAVKGTRVSIASILSGERPKIEQCLDWDSNLEPHEDKLSNSPLGHRRARNAVEVYIYMNTETSRILALL